MNRTIDYRSDYYSLGVTLYEIFTGTLPFTGTDAEILHSHIARQPADPSSVNSEIPEILSSIILKLMAKNAEDRYQTLSGVKSDLEHCFRNITSGKTDSNFLICQNDISKKFIIPQKLYGRESELNLLKTRLTASDQNRLRMLLISGYSGIGKTSIVNEISKRIIEKDGHYVSGKFDKLEKNNPYSALKTAISDLIKTIILENETLDEWKIRLQQALDSNGIIIARLIPELEQIIGKQPEIQNLSPAEEKARFQMVFHDFLNALTSDGRELAIFFDDLQWSDISFIDLMKHLLMSSTLGNILIIGAYRDNEVDENHPLIMMLEEAKQELDPSDVIYTLHLDALHKEDVNNMLSDTLRYEPKKTKKLSDIVYKKTKGNPFFTRELMRSLYNSGSIWFDENSQNWKWELEEIDSAKISENVVEFLVNELKDLDAHVVATLKSASCIGNQFNLKLLYLIADDISDITEGIQTAINRELIIPVSANYKIMHIPREEFLKSDIHIAFKFNHDRIQQSVYSLLSEDEKEIIHKKIGDVILNQKKKQGEAGYNTYEITNHLNIAKKLIAAKEDRIRLSDLNYISGKSAKECSSFIIAKNYFETCLQLLDDAEWKEFPDRFFDASLEYIESGFWAGNIDGAMEMCDGLNAKTENIIQKARVHALKAVIIDMKAEKREMIIEEITKGLKLFDIELPTDEKDLDERINEGIGAMLRHLESIRPKDLVTLPEMTDPYKTMAMNLLFQVVPAAFQSSPPLYTYIQLTMFDMSIQYGVTEFSCKNFVECGIILGPILKNYSLGYEYSKASFDLLQRFNTHSIKKSAYFVFAAFISHWKAHYSESLEYFDMSIKSSLATGDIVYCTYAMEFKLHRQIYVGKNLSEVKEETRKFVKFCVDNSSEYQLIFTDCYELFIKHLQADFSEEAENHLLQKVMKDDSTVTYFSFGGFNLIANYILGNIENASKWAEYSEQYAQTAPGIFYAPDHYMFSSLVLIKQLESMSGTEADDVIKRLDTNLELLKVWADNCPQNFAHKYYLLAAEILNVKNESIDLILENYKRALDSIAHGEFLNIRAVINELIGEFWLKRNEKLIGITYLRESYYYYSQWGAYSKTVLLEKKFPEIFSKKITLNSTSLNSDIYSRSTGVYSFDIISILKSTMAISSVTKIDKLLEILLHTVIENAGAQNGCIILNSNTEAKLNVEAIKKKFSDDIEVSISPLLKDSSDYSYEIINYVTKTNEDVVLDCAYKDTKYSNDAYLKNNEIKSVLCAPILYKGNLIGIIYLENNLAEYAFNIERIEITKILTSFIAVSIENIRLYESLEQKVLERTRQLEIANTELKELSLLDPLTKIHNRRFVYDQLSSIFEKFAKKKVTNPLQDQKRDASIKNNIMGVCLIDVDYFKKVNDTFGHKTGDEVLITVCDLLKNIIRDDDFIIRWGGEEFLIILNKTKLEYLEVFSQKVLSLFSTAKIPISDKNNIRITVSLGVTHMPLLLEYQSEECLSLEQIINVSDFALYQAKESGRNCAAHISLNNKIKHKHEKIKEYLSNLSKYSEINYDYINVTFFRNHKQ